MCLARMECGSGGIVGALGGREGLGRAGGVAGMGRGGEEARFRDAV